MDERRILTVMFCDIVASTDLAGALDPEDLSEIIRSYQEIGATAVTTVGGHVAQYLGDGMLVYFGWPVAREDDALRAIRAGIDILGNVADLNKRLEPHHGVRLRVRIGIQTGPTVIGSVGAGPNREMQAFGATPNIAKRIQEAAEPDSILVGDGTVSLVEGFFELEDRGLLDARGVQKPVRVARVVRERRHTRRFSIVQRRGLTPIVAREEERAFLEECWQEARRGGTSISVLLSGDAGIGKSRLVDSLEHRVSDASGIVIAAQCMPLSTNTPLAPIAAALRDTWESEDDPLKNIADAVGESAETSVPLLADLAGIKREQTDRSPLRGWTPQRVRRATMAAVSAYLHGRSRVEPLLFVVEDLHWADPSTLELLEQLVDTDLRGGVLNVFTARPEFKPSWSRLRRRILGPLSAEASEVLVRHTAQGAALPPNVVSHLMGRADGNPFFIEELTKTVIQFGHLEQGGGTITRSSEAVPSTVYGGLMARIDTLGAARRLLQIAALIGQQVDPALLDVTSGLSRQAVAGHVSRLVRAELLSSAAGHGLTFRHALIRDAAADALVSSDRRAIESRIAEALIKEFPERADAEPERVAHHLTQAEKHGEAIDWWQRAARSAIQRSANVEAIAHLRAALQIAPELPEGPEKLVTTLEAHTLIGVPLTLTRGWAHPEVGATYERASQLCAVVEKSSQLSSRVGLTTYYLVRGQFRHAREMAMQSRETAESLGDTGFLLEAEHDCGTCSLYLGEFDRSLSHLARVEALYDLSLHARHAWMFGKDPLAVALVHRAMALACTGSVDSAMAAVGEAVRHAEACGHPFSYLWALIGTAITRIVRDEPLEAAEVAAVIARQSEAQGFPNWLAQAQMYVGLGEVLQGDHQTGVDRIRGGLALWESTGAALGVPILVCLLARGLLLAGRFDEAREQVAYALATADRTEERWTLPEALRLRGDIELASSGAEAAAPFYQAALDEARRSGARTFEVAASNALATTLLLRGARAEAEALLKPALATMAEGHGSRHARRTRELLEGWSAVS